MTKDEREIIRDLEHIGVSVDIEPTSNHIKLKVGYRDRKKIFICSKTPSDRRARMNNLSLVRRWKKEIDAFAS